MNIGIIAIDSKWMEKIQQLLLFFLFHINSILFNTVTLRKIISYCNVLEGYRKKTWSCLSFWVLPRTRESSNWTLVFVLCISLMYLLCRQLWYMIMFSFIYNSSFGLSWKTVESRNVILLFNAKLILTPVLANISLNGLWLWETNHSLFLFR